ncbi:MAG: trypsin-like serine protease, partial [Chloroflexi bacterium]|nr:trypsin-like serine protease [Chloroflexota bacterium]
MKNTPHKTLALLPAFAHEVVEINCTSSEATNVSESTEPASETAFLKTAEATSNEAVGMVHIVPRSDGTEVVEIVPPDALAGDGVPMIIHTAEGNIDGVPISDLVNHEEKIEALASMERADWEYRLTEIWEDSISGVVLITLGNTLVPGNGTGAGWFWDDEGHIVTNYHVVRPTTSFVTPITIIVETFDGDQFEAEIIGGDPVSDIAVLKIDAGANVSDALPIGDSADLKPGMTAIALGHPFGIDQAFSMTHGIISGLSRSILADTSTMPIPAVIQTDADMNPGNSGGPLLNSAGEVIGVNTQIRSLTSTNSGVGFATPINLVRRVVNSLIEEGVHEYPLIGISSRVVTRAWAEELDLEENQRGLLVTAVSPDGPADEAGIRSDTGTFTSSSSGFQSFSRYNPKGDGDIIVRIDNVKIDN